MGQLPDKCNCFYKDEKNTFSVEDENYNNTFKNKNIYSIVDNNINVKNTYDANTYIAKNINNNQYKSTNSNILNLKHLEDKYSDLKNKDNINKIINIQSIIKGIIYRKHFALIKPKLIEDIIETINSYASLFTTNELKKAENYNIINYTTDGWTKYYTEDKNIFNIDYGIIVYTRLLISNNKSEIYSGETNIYNKKHGYGVKLDDLGNKYEGFWYNDKFSGWGKLIDKEGNTYIGLFINDKLNGYGEKQTLTGNIYRGEFIDNLKHGKGIEENSEHIYEGEFYQDKKEGKGKLTYIQISDSYEGEFKNNTITGTGFYIWSNKDTYQGTFIDGKMHGKGIYKWPDGGEYIGEYKDNIKEGYGKFKWCNGKIYKGPFKNGKPHGIGKLLLNDISYDVEFIEGKLTSNNKEKNSIN